MPSECPFPAAFREPQQRQTERRVNPKKVREFFGSDLGPGLGDNTICAVFAETRIAGSVRILRSLVINWLCSRLPNNKGQFAYAVLILDTSP